MSDTDLSNLTPEDPGTNNIPFSKGSTWGATTKALIGDEYVPLAGGTITGDTTINSADLIFTGGTETVTARVSSGTSGLEIYTAAGASVAWNGSQVEIGGGLSMDVNAITSSGAITTTGAVTGGSLIVSSSTFEGLSTSTGGPTTSELDTSGDWGIHEDTDDSRAFLAYNDAATIKRAELYEDVEWTTPTLATGWAEFGGGYQDTRYCKRNGVVYIEGHPLRTSGTETIIFTLPAGCRPAATLYLPALASSSTSIGRFWINSSGEVDYRAGSLSSYFAINCSFYVG